jgi:hypothetical protein
MKVLCCCEGGNTRSVTLATLLKYYFRPSAGHDALAMAIGKNSPATKEMLYGWADRILVVDEGFVDDIPPEYRSKVTTIPIGRDNWGMSMHPELVPLAIRLLQEAGFELKENGLERAVVKRGRFERRLRGLE